MIKAVIFDFDHTLYDRVRTNRSMAPQFYKALGKFLDPNVSLETFTEALLSVDKNPKNHYHEGYQGMIDDMNKMGVFAQVPERMEYLSILYPNLSENIKMYDDAYDMLQTLKKSGYKLGLLTNGYPEVQRMKLSYTKVPEYMDALLIGGDLKYPKPHPKAFVAILEQLGITAEEAVYVGDQPYADICGARSVGMKTVWIPYADLWPDTIAKPDAMIKKLSELPALLKEELR